MKRLLFSLLTICIGWQAHSQEYKLHPVYIYSFTKYVVWPDSYKTGDFQILVLGDSPIVKELMTMASLKKTPDNRNIVVTKIDSQADIKKCNVLYVTSGKSKQLADIMAKIGTQPILVVTEEPGLGAKGSNINFIVKDGKLAFEMNQATMGKQGLKASSELSRLAIQI